METLNEKTARYWRVTKEMGGSPRPPASHMRSEETGEIEKMKWEKVKFGTVCHLVNGKAYKPSDWSSSGVPIVRIQNLNDLAKPFNYWSGALDNQVKVRSGDVLLAWSGTPGTSFGAHVWRGGSGVLNQHIFRVDLDLRKITKEWAVYAVNNQLNRLIDQAHGGVGLKHVTKSMVESLEIPLPPLAEQRRIAAILDTADALREKRRQIIAKLDTLLRAVFLEMFGDPVKNPKGWPLITISSFVEAFQGGKSLLSDSNESPQFVYRVLKVSAVTAMSYKPEESKPVPSDYVPPREHIVRSGDLLFSRANTTELVGAVAYVWDTPENILLPDKLWRFVWSKPQSASPLFIWSLFQTHSFRYELGKRATGTSGSMKNISQEKLLAMKIPLPELKLQQQFASIVECVQRVQKAHAESNRIMDNLFYSIQQRAFTGKLFAEKAAAVAD